MHIWSALMYTTSLIIWQIIHIITMTSSNGNIFRVSGPLCGEFNGHQWSPIKKASDVELWCFRLSEPWINNWVNNREVGYLRRHCAHYDVIAMFLVEYHSWLINHGLYFQDPAFSSVLLVINGFPAKSLRPTKSIMTRPITSFASWQVCLLPWSNLANKHDG